MLNTRTRNVTLAIFTVLFALGAVTPAGAAGRSLTEKATFTGEAGSTTLKIAVGDVEVTIAGGESMATFASAGKAVQALDIDDRFETSCGSGTVSVAGATSCLNRSALREVNFSKADASSVSGEDLVAAGLATYTSTGGMTTVLSDQGANATSHGLVIPGLAEGNAKCDAKKLTDSVVALATPKELAPILEASLGTASCAVAVKGLPNATHEAGEIAAEISLTKTIVDAVPVNDALDQIQAAGPLPAEVNNAIDAIQTKLSSEPIVEIHVAPNVGTVNAVDAGISSSSPGVAVIISVLGGILEVEIGIAKTSAAVLNGVPTARADVAFARVKALDITTPDPVDALIDEQIEAPNSFSLLEGTPLETHVDTNRGVTSTQCPTGSGMDKCARASGDALSVSLLSAPLPNVSVQLAHTEVLAAARYSSASTEPVIPVTGAAAGGTVLAGLALAGGALAIRRRLV